MKVTPTMLRVLHAIEERGEGHCMMIDHAMWPETHKYRPLRAGQYAGRLVNMGLLHKYYEEYRGKHGRLIALGARYSLTALARDILRSER